ncbi:unnamed protein product [Protopolystoma xenopodis]|uniref:Uncharacterized protein n=1 Tax=Protopolystoma xenopodis TaxID=117903 RepID=A0A3S5AKP0_9PLAT|nr:unnamed protein product [Protopolystoma xenopodis]
MAALKAPSDPGPASVSFQPAELKSTSSTAPESTAFALGAGSANSASLVAMAASMAMVMMTGRQRSQDGLMPGQSDAAAGLLSLPPPSGLPGRDVVEGRLLHSSASDVRVSPSQQPPSDSASLAARAVVSRPEVPIRPVADTHGLGTESSHTQLSTSREAVVPRPTGVEATSILSIERLLSAARFTPDRNSATPASASTCSSQPSPRPASTASSTDSVSTSVDQRSSDRRRPDVTAADSNPPDDRRSLPVAAHHLGPVVSAFTATELARFILAQHEATGSSVASSPSPSPSPSSPSSPSPPSSPSSPSPSPSSFLSPGVSTRPVVPASLRPTQRATATCRDGGRRLPRDKQTKQKRPGPREDLADDRVAIASEAGASPPAAKRATPASPDSADAIGWRQSEARPQMMNGFAKRPRSPCTLWPSQPGRHQQAQTCSTVSKPTAGWPPHRGALSPEPSAVVANVNVNANADVDVAFEASPNGPRGKAGLEQKRPGAVLTAPFGRPEAVLPSESGANGTRGLVGGAETLVNRLALAAALTPCKSTESHAPTSDMLAPSLTSGGPQQGWMKLWQQNPSFAAAAAAAAAAATIAGANFLANTRVTP